MTTLSNGPYLTARIPGSHRGRINGVASVIQSILQGVSMFFVGRIYDVGGSTIAWYLVFGLLITGIFLGLIWIRLDRRYYADLYKLEEI